MKVKNNRKGEPLISADDYPCKAKKTQDITVAENEPIVTIDDVIDHKKKLLMRKLLIIVILVNLLVLISIIVCT